MSFDYEGVMPTFFASGWTSKQVESYLSNHHESQPTPEPPVKTEAEIKAAEKVIADCYCIDGVEKSGGLLGISKVSDMPLEFVEKVVDELKAGITAYENGGTQ